MLKTARAYLHLSELWTKYRSVMDRQKWSAITAVKMGIFHFYLISPEVHT